MINPQKSEKLLFYREKNSPYLGQSTRPLLNTESSEFSIESLVEQLQSLKLNEELDISERPRISFPKITQDTGVEGDSMPILESLIQEIKKSISQNDEFNWHQSQKQFSDICDQLESDEVTEDFFKKIQDENKEYFDWWPHLSPVENLGGYLFFPKELIDLYDSTCSLYSRDHIILQLVFSAKYKNPLARHHLIALLDKRVENKITDLELEESDQLPENLQKAEGIIKLLDVKQKKLKDLIEKEKKLPFWTLANMSAKEEEEDEYLRLGAEGEDWRCAGALLENQLFSEELSSEGVERKHEEIASFYKKVQDSPKSYLKAAKYEKANQEALNLYLKCANGGVAEGYFEAAKIVGDDSGVNYEFKDLELPFAKEIPLHVRLYMKAGKEGMLSGFSAAAWYFEKQKDHDKARQIYLEKAKSGDRSSYFDVARFTKEEDDKSNLYKKSELVSIDDIVRTIEYILEEI